MKKPEKLEILDVTLRDGEQTRGVSFSSDEKLNIAKFLLLNLRVTRVEVASARVSKGELQTVKNIMKWAESESLGNRIEILGFVDKTQSVDWIVESGARTLNLLTKGSLNHLTNQLKKTISEHVSDIKETVEYAVSKGITLNIYLEDWSNGILNSPEYVMELIERIRKFPISRIFLPDTLGVMSPDEAFESISLILSKFPEIHFEFHGHNDYDLSVANCLAAVKAGIRGLHVSINGLGERAGNSPLEAVITAIHDKMKIDTGVVEKEITQASRLVETVSGKRISDNRP
ncbi:MAG: 2-isopropylmalate synthase, partial [Leptospira sp.]|nr:2-isopropylmalate synthase [Leptospira sp.]